MAKTVKGNVSKEKILKKSIELFAKKGFYETSFQNIADALEISQSALFHYFKNKLVLFEMLMNEIVLVNHQIVNQKVQIEDNAKVRLEKHCWANFDWAYGNPMQAKMLLLLYNHAATNSDLSKLATKLTETGKTRVAECLYMAEREGLLKPQVNPAVWGEILHKFLLSYVFQMVTLQQDRGNLKSQFADHLREIEKVLFV